MSKTISSGSTAVLLCPVAEFLKRIDQSTVAQLCSDDPDNPVDVTALPTEPNCLAALWDACGMVEATALMGKRYEAEDLLALAQAAPPVYATAMLWRVISDLAWVFLWERRPNKQVAAPPSLERTQAWLEQLAQGTKIFAFAETEAAGLPETDVETPREVASTNLSTFQAERYFGRRANRELPRVR